MTSEGMPTGNTAVALDGGLELGNVAISMDSGSADKPVVAMTTNLGGGDAVACDGPWPPTGGGAVPGDGPWPPTCGGAVPGDGPWAKGSADKPVVAVTANLAQMLPSGTVMVYQMLASSFSNKGKCYTANWYITMILLVMLALSAVFFVWTDSFVHKGKLYYGMAICGRLNVFNLSKQQERFMFREILPELKKRGLKRKDFVHAFLVVLVFLSMAFTDVEIQNCFFPNAGMEAQQLLKNLPLGVTVFASLVFTLFPTNRKFIGSNDHTVL